MFGFPVYAFPATMVILALYVVSDSLHNIYRVPIEMLTIPEDHLRRFRLTKNIFKHIPWFKNMVSDLDTGIQKEIAGVLQSVILEENVLSGKSKGVLKFLRLEADTMGCLVDGKALHLAVVADRDEIVKVRISFSILFLPIMPNLVFLFYCDNSEFLTYYSPKKHFFLSGVD